MKIQYCSDLHLEFPENKLFLKTHPLKPVADTLILAGDIVPFGQMDKHKDFFKYISDHFEISYWIPGNHEYYHFDLATKNGTLHEKIKKNVHLVNNIAIENKNARFVFSTLWTKINPAHQMEIERNMNDFHTIKYNKFRFSTTRYTELHEQCLQFIETTLQILSTLKTIVVTHHVPTFMHYPEQYKGGILNEAFAVELFEFINKYEPNYWVYGHHHSNTPDFSIGTTKMLTNQLGYVIQNEHKMFGLDKLIEL
jgi:predicted phosphohydrolase